MRMEERGERTSGGVLILPPGRYCPQIERMPISHMTARYTRRRLQRKPKPEELPAIKSTRNTPVLDRIRRSSVVPTRSGERVNSASEHRNHDNHGSFSRVATPASPVDSETEIPGFWRDRGRRGTGARSIESLNAQHLRTFYMEACRRFRTPPLRRFLSACGKETVNLNNRSLNALGLKAMCVPLTRDDTITTLCLSGNNLGPEGMRHLADVLKTNYTLLNLDVSCNGLGSEGVKHVHTVLLENETLRSLDVSGNNFTETDATWVADALESNQYLKHLNLSENLFSLRGGGILGPAIARNTTLESLDLSWNSLRLRGSVAVIQGVEANKGLRSLNLSWNGLGMSGAQALQQCLIRNQTLSDLDVTCNRIPAPGLLLLAKALRINESLATLKIGKNALNTDIACAFVEMIKMNPVSSMTTLVLQGVATGLQAEDAIKESVKSRPLDVQYTLEPIRATTTITVPAGAPRKTHAVDPLTVLMKHIEDQNINLIEMFREMDKDNSWSVSRDEFKEGMQAAEIPMTEDQIESLMDSLDKDGDGEIDFGELMIGQRDHMLKQVKYARYFEIGFAPSPLPSSDTES